MLISLISDTHFGVKGDAEYMLQYQEKFYKEFFFPTLIKQGVKTILHGGDLMDRRKYVNFNTLTRMKKMFLEPASELGMKIHIIPGNHDVFYKQTNEVNSLRELLYGYDNIEIIESPKILKFDKVNILMLPWLNTTNYKDSMKFVSDNDADVLYGHLELSGFSMYAGVENESGMDATIFNKFPKTVTGHFHHQSQKGNIHYLGAPMEFTWSDCEDERGFHIFDTETKKLEYQRNPHTMFVKLQYDDSTADKQDMYRMLNVGLLTGKIVKLIVVKKTNPVLFEDLIDRMYKVDMVDLTIMENYTEFKEVDIDEEIKYNSTKDLMDKYIETATTEMNKTRLKGILNSLYIEALHTETI